MNEQDRARLRKSRELAFELVTASHEVSAGRMTHEEAFRHFGQVCGDIADRFDLVLLIQTLADFVAMMAGLMAPDDPMSVIRSVAQRLASEGLDEDL